MKTIEQINMQLDNLVNAYSQYSTEENKELNSEFANYIFNQAEDVGLKSEIEINIKLKKDSSEEEKNKLKKVYVNHFNRYIKEVKQEIRRCFIIATLMMLVGIAFATLFYFVPKYFIFEFVTEIGSWVFAWEAIYIIGFKVPSISHKNYLYKKLLRAKINFI